MQSPFHVSESARAIVETLKEVLDCTVLLYDGDEGRMHLYRFEDSWMTFKSAGILEEGPSKGCRIDQAINERWWLHLMKKSSLHPDARRLAPWAAQVLAKELPAGGVPKVSLPPGGGGGGGGSADMGIPVWWARKSRR